MHDFVDSYRDRPATTEDFKAAMEKNLPPWLDVEKNHRLDWFFNAFVYGTEVPGYEATSTFEKTGDDTTVHMKISQSGVSDDFVMLVPVYLELENGMISQIGHAVMKGSSDQEKTVNVGKLPAPAKRIVMNYNYDILSTN